MESQRCSVVKKLSLMLTWVLLLAVSSFAQSPDEATSPSPVKKYHFGARLGTWVNLGDTALPRVQFINDDDEIVGLMETNINNVSFYFEGYFAYNIFQGGYVEFSMGMVNRGSVTVADIFSTDIGNLMLYPFLLQFKYYPFSTLGSRIQPYVAGGGGLYYGRQSIQFTTNLFDDAFLRGESATDFNFVLSGGVDYSLNDNLALDFNAKYMPVSFSDQLILMSDYDALAITVGIKYLYGGRK